MDTIRGEPEWVNWSQREWEIEEAMQDAATVGAMINDDLERLQEMLPSCTDQWAKHYDLNGKLELFHHDLLKLYEQAKFLGINK